MDGNVSLFLPSPCRAPLAVWSPGNRPRSRTEAVFTAHCKMKKEERRKKSTVALSSCRCRRKAPAAFSLPPPWPQQIVLSADQESGGKELRTTGPPASICPSRRIVLKRVKRATSVSQTFSLPPASYLKKRWNHQALASIYHGIQISQREWDVCFTCVKHNRQSCLVDSNGSTRFLGSHSTEIDRLHLPTISFTSFLERSASCQHSVGRASLEPCHKENSIRYSVPLYLFVCLFVLSKQHCLGTIFCKFLNGISNLKFWCTV